VSVSDPLIGVIGSGAWGTALAVLSARAGRRTILWTRTPQAAARMSAERRNEARLPGVALPPALAITSDGMSVAAADIVLLAVPAQTIRDALAGLGAALRGPVVICAKGLDRLSGRLPSEVLVEAAPLVRAYALSGPGFAGDVARGLPTAVTLGGADRDEAVAIAAVLAQATFRIYASDDLRGVQIGGALKNVMAIACGISDGRGFGESARAALTTRAFAEMTRLGQAFGAQAATLAGLSGLGDLILTCASPQSRNYSLGFALGSGQPLSQAIAGQSGVSEGLYTAAVAVALARRHGVDAPLCQAVDAVLSGASSPEHEIARLLSRPLRSE
jgi:glycerol-3-phosphate dehydrogenase (NAD(P)+)